MSTTLPKLSLETGWILGESGWGPAVNQNFKTIDAITHIGVLGQGIVPLTGAPGDMYIDALGNVWSYSTLWEMYNPTMGMTAYVQSTGIFLIYNGSAWVDISTITNSGGIVAASVASFEAIVARVSAAGDSFFNTTYNDNVYFDGTDWLFSGSKYSEIKYIPTTLGSGASPTDTILVIDSIGENTAAGVVSGSDFILPFGGLIEITYSFELQKLPGFFISDEYRVKGKVKTPAGNPFQVSIITGKMTDTDQGAHSSFDKIFQGANPGEIIQMSFLNETNNAKMHISKASVFIKYLKAKLP